MIRPVGLAPTKAKNIINAAKMVGLLIRYAYTGGGQRGAEWADVCCRVCVMCVCMLCVLGSQLVERFNSQVPSNYPDLESLPGTRIETSRRRHVGALVAEGSVGVSVMGVVDRGGPQDGQCRHVPGTTSMPFHAFDFSLTLDSEEHFGSVCLFIINVVQRRSMSLPSRWTRMCTA